jgi:Na+-translocating ferredoxin:NAD+ oxidoreductase RnfG subunit
MKKFFINNLSILILTLVLVIIFVLGGMFSRYMTAQIDVHDFDQSIIQLVEDGKRIENFSVEQLEMEYLVPGSETNTYQPVLKSAHKVLNADNEEIAVVYIIVTKGYKDGVETAYAIDIDSKKIINVKVMKSSETPDKFNLLDNSFFNQFNNKALDSVPFKLDSVAGVTYSSKALETGMLYARELFAIQYDFEIPGIIYEITNVTRNSDTTTFLTKPFIVDVTYGENDSQFQAYFNNNYEFVELISGDMPTEDYLDVLKEELPKSSFIEMRAFVSDFDSTANTVTIYAKGYDAMDIEVVFHLNSSLDQVTSMDITTTQTYEYSYEYSGSPAPAVENAFGDQYLIDGTIIDGKAGATITSNAMKRILTVMNELKSAWNEGGN